MTKTIKITCKGQQYIPLGKLKAFQGNLKELRPDEFEKLKRSILKYGFSFPVFVWKNNLLDGHQRVFVTAELVKEGYAIGDIPAVEIDAKDETEAAEKLLFINSRYAEITKSGLDEFLNAHNLEIDLLKNDLNLYGIDFEPEKIDEGQLDKDGQDLADAIDAEKEIESTAEQTSDDILELISKRLANVAKNQPHKLAKAMALILSNQKRCSDVFILIDPNLKDFISELKRYSDAKADSPLEKLLAHHYPMVATHADGP